MGKKMYVLGIALILLLTVVQLPGARYHKVFKRADMNCEIGRKFQVGEEDSAGGKFVTAPKFSFDKGDYIVTVSYAADSEGNYVSFRNKIGNDGKTVNETHELPAAISWGIHRIPLHLESYTEDLRIDLYYGGEKTLELFDITVEGVKWQPQDVLAIGFLVLSCYLFAGIFLFREKGIGEKSAVYLTLLLAAIFSSYPFFTDCLMDLGGDMRFHLMRIVGIRDGLLSGQFPVRVYPSAFYGTGCAYSMYYPDLFLYVPALLCVAGCSVAVSVQIFNFLVHFAAAYAMYYAAGKMGGKRTARLLCSIVYVFSMYFCMNVYFRFDLGETLAMCFFPLVICGFYTIVFEEGGSFWPLCLGMSGLLMSHMLSTLFAGIFLAFFGVIFIRKVFKKRVLVQFMKAIVTAFGLCVWFLAPLARVSRESNNIIQMKRVTYDHAIDAGTLFGIFGRGERNDPRNLGFMLIFGTVICFYCALSRSIGLNKRKRGLFLALSVTGIAIALCATPLFPWKMLMGIPAISGLISLVQFPWRLLGPASAFLSLSTGMALAVFWKNIKPRALVALVFAVSLVFFAFPIENIYWLKDPYISRGDAVQETKIAQDYLHQGTEKEKLKRAKPDAQGMEILEYEKKGSEIRMRVNAKAGSHVDTSLLFFTGYKAFDEDGNEVACVSGENNRIRIEFPEAYEGGVTVRYTGLLRWRLTDLVSLFTALAAVCAGIARRRRLPPPQPALRLNKIVK